MSWLHCFHFQPLATNNPSLPLLMTHQSVPCRINALQLAAVFWKAVNCSCVVFSQHCTVCICWWILLLNYYWTNADLLSITPSGTNFQIEILDNIQTFSLKKIHFKMLSVRCWPFCPYLNVMSRTTVSSAMTFIFSQQPLNNWTNPHHLLVMTSFHSDWWDWVN